MSYAESRNYYVSIIFFSERIYVGQLCRLVSENDVSLLHEYAGRRILYFVIWHSSVKNWHAVLHYYFLPSVGVHTTCTYNYIILPSSFYCHCSSFFVRSNITISNTVIVVVEANNNEEYHTLILFCCWSKDKRI